MIVYRGKNIGFCFGVKRAIDKAEELGKGTFILGKIIHNDKVNNELNEKGLIFVNSIEDERITKGSKLIIRAHGEAEQVYIRAKELGVEIIDCTCPFVKQIHKLVNEHYIKGYDVVIIGNKTHPEVIGIKGWCNNKAHVINSLEELQAIESEKLCIVVQTTYSIEKFNEIIENFNHSNIKTVDIFKTICYTTTDRQQETKIISKLSDCVVIIGDKNSNNTDKLYSIAKEGCLNSIKISSSNELDFNKIKKFKKVGIVLGASTPIKQFQEVISNMENVTEEIIVSGTQEEGATATQTKSEITMQDAFDKIKPSRDFKINQVITAKISSATETGLTISIKDAKKDFELAKEELLNDYNKDDYKDKIGSEIRVMVVGKNPIRFSEKAMAKVLAEEAEIEEIKNGKIFEAEVIATNKGGLTSKLGNYQVFIPASQIKLGFVKDLEKYVGKTLRLKAEKVESKGFRKQIIASQKSILLEEKKERDAIYAAKKEEFFGNIQVGDVVLGTPVRFSPFGAFIEVNGFDCLCHISDLSWVNCKDCAEVLEIGKKYEFQILKIEEEKEKVSLGYKQLQPKPWDSVEEKYHVGDVVKGTVVRLVNFGAFVELEKGIDGLVHVSQISNEWLENPVSALQVGQEIEAKIIEINLEKEKINLSIKALLPEVEKTEEEKPAKKGKGKKVAEENEEQEEMREWKEDSNDGVSIAEMLGNKE